MRINYNEKIKLAMIGCGGRAKAHLKGLVTFEDVELVGFCDIIEERARDFAQTAGKGECFTDFKDMLEATEPDAVTIAVPPHVHGEIEFEVIERGIHFLIERFAVRLKAFIVLNAEV